MSELMQLNKEEAALLLELLRVNNISIPYSHWKEITQAISTLEFMAQSD